MQPNATIERLLDLSACYLGLRECRFDAVAGAANDDMHAAPEQGGSHDSSLRSGH